MAFHLVSLSDKDFNTYQVISIQSIGMQIQVYNEMDGYLHVDVTAELKNETNGGISRQSTFRRLVLDEKKNVLDEKVHTQH